MIPRISALVTSPVYCFQWQSAQWWLLCPILLHLSNWQQTDPLFLEKSTFATNLLSFYHISTTFSLSLASRNLLWYRREGVALRLQLLLVVLDASDVDSEMGHFKFLMACLLVHSFFLLAFFCSSSSTRVIPLLYTLKLRVSSGKTLGIYW